MLIKKFSHTLPTSDIVLKQDKESGEETDRYVGYTAGRFFPLIKIKETLIDFAKIESFTLTIGDSFLPQFSCIVMDDDLTMQETNIVEMGEIITFFIGNAKDLHHNTIKNDYYVLPNSTIDTYFSLSGILHVPKLYDKPNRVFQNKTTLEVFEELAKECQLGFVTNIELTNDRMDWIQYQNTLDFFKYLESKSFISNDTKVKIFIDQFANLNVIDIKKSIDSSPITMMVTDIMTGEELEENVLLEAANYQVDPDGKKAIYESYNVSADYGSIARLYPSELNIKNLNISTLEETDTKIISKHKKHLEKASTYTNFSNDNAFNEYFQSTVRNAYNELLTKGKHIDLDFNTFVAGLYVYMTLPNTIYNYEKFTSHQNQNKNIGLEQEYTETPPNEVSVLDHINEKLSGDLLVTGMTISFSRAMNDGYNSIRQKLNTFLKKSVDLITPTESNNSNQPQPQEQQQPTNNDDTPMNNEEEPQQPTDNSSLEYIYYLKDGYCLGGNISSKKIYIVTQEEYNSAKNSNNWTSVNDDKNLLKEKGVAMTHNDFVQKASTIYGESSAFRVGMEAELLKEMTAIAFVHKVNKIAYGANSTQAKLFRQKTYQERNKTKMKYAPAAIIASLTTTNDLSNGATMWDGIEQAMFPITDNRYSNGSFEIHMNTMGWTISDTLHAKWKQGVERLNGSFKAPKEKYTPGKYPGNRYATANTIALEAKAVYLGTIFWKELKKRKQRP